MATWTVEKRYEIVLEMLGGKESIAQIARQHKAGKVLLHRWGVPFFEDGRADLALENGAADRGITGRHRRTGGRNPFLRKTIEDVKPSWGAVEAARMEVGLKNRARNPSPQDVAAELLPACPRHHRLHAPPPDLGSGAASRHAAESGAEAAGSQPPQDSRVCQGLVATRAREPGTSRLNGCVATLANGAL